MMATGAATTTTNKVCLNVKCCATGSTNWRPGWSMRSGRIADLCDSCGLAYEQLRFCETFHADDAGWRTCNSCKKRVHCGCIASIYSFILLDTGGVECINCARKSNSTNTNPHSINHFATLSGKNLDSANIGGRFQWMAESGSWFPFPFQCLPSTTQAGGPHWQHLPEVDRLVDSDRIAENSTGEMTSAADSNKAEEDSNVMFKDDSKNAEGDISGQPTRLECLDRDSQREDVSKANIVDVDAKIFTDSGAAKDSSSQEHFVTGKVDGSAAVRLGTPDGQVKSTPEDAMDFHDSSILPVSKVLAPAMDQREPCPSSHLIMSLGLYPAKDDASEANEHAGSSAPTTFTGSAGTQGDSRDHAKFSGLSSVRHRQRQLLPKPPQSQPATRAEISKESSLQVPIRVARPPGEGRGRNQLLPRYWPRITDQELQQITSGGLNSTITPLFEKMLSASDAGRIGRLVLPKACAEAYFPSISQPEGLPLKIQDVSGKEWVFQFRFWPNNNSRMYVLEGVTPCIQSMQLQAGDTVTFSRLDPEGKLVMGYRRAPNSLSAQDVQVSTTGIPTAGVSLDSGGIDNIPTITGVAGLLPESLKSGSEPQFNGLPGPFNMSETGYGWFKTEKVATKPKEGALYQSLLEDRRKGRHLGSKSKRLRMEVEESIELKLSWEEAQELLRPPPNIAPTIVTIDGHEFEEYEEPPIFGKRTIFTTRHSGSGDDQWAQCDDCGSWRKVPSNVFLPTRWTCADNAWDPKRASCIAPREVNSEEIENLLHHIKDVKKQEDMEPPKVNGASSGLDALANAATLGDNNTASSSSPAATTKHPRHRPGCTCIVCIQPPSGKGPKHKPTCVCNVCMTVKRRFKTLMMRRKKRQTEREAETARKKRAWAKEEGEVNSGTKWRNDTYSFPENVSKQGNLAATFPGSLPRTSNLSSNGNGFPSTVAAINSYPSKAKAAGEECLSSKGHIDLNSKPERDDEQSKGTGRLSMVRLLQNASYPLDKYMNQHGLTSLICPQQMLVTSMGFARNVSDRRVDEYTGSQSALLTPDKSQEEPFLVLGGARGDTATSDQSFEIMERKSSIQVPNQGS